MSGISRRAEAAEAVTVRNVSQDYGTSRVLNGVDFALPTGQVMALLGPSGCGKTTLLRLVAGLLAPSIGSVGIAGNLVADASTGFFLPPEKRGLGMVFQDYALWPHMTIGENVAFPLEMRGIGRSERETRVEAALQRVGLGGFGARRPSDLSGGQQQRVAIARAIVAEPGLVLFDEPLSNLDRELREQLVGEIGELVATLGLTALYVTHDQAEAFSLADSVAVMRGGHIVQADSPEQLVAQPATPDVAEFLKLGTVVEVEAHGDGWWLPGAVEALLPRSLGPAGTDDAVLLLTRSALRPVASGEGQLQAVVRRSQFRGDHHLLTLVLPRAGEIELSLTSDRRAQPGERLGLALVPEALRWFARSRPVPVRLSEPAL
ncbi:ABC transporter ATP-binding protein [Radicibacter daui]|uniref:ABC transporter ATP-binding protein n=1 Tax=Radicibacter daui TaxID=3064829 RepID=UPI004046AC21